MCVYLEINEYVKWLLKSCCQGLHFALGSQSHKGCWDMSKRSIQGPVFLSIGPDTKLYMLKTFDLNKPFDLHLDTPLSENLPLCRIMQDSKDPIITTDFYLTNVEPREWILPTPYPSSQ